MPFTALFPFHLFVNTPSSSLFLQFTHTFGRHASKDTDTHTHGNKSCFTGVIRDSRLLSCSRVCSVSVFLFFADTHTHTHIHRHTQTHIDARTHTFRCLVVFHWRSFHIIRLLARVTVWQSQRTRSMVEKGIFNNDQVVPLHTHTHTHTLPAPVWCRCCEKPSL